MFDPRPLLLSLLSCLCLGGCGGACDCRAPEEMAIDAGAPSPAGEAGIRAVGDALLVPLAAPAFSGFGMAKRRLAYYLSQAAVALDEAAYHQTCLACPEIHGLLTKLLAQGTRLSPQAQGALADYAIPFFLAHGYDQGRRKLLCPLGPTELLAEATRAGLKWDEARLEPLLPYLYDGSYPPRGERPPCLEGKERGGPGLGRAIRAIKEASEVAQGSQRLALSQLAAFLRGGEEKAREDYLRQFRQGSDWIKGMIGFFPGRGCEVPSALVFTVEPGLKRVRGLMARNLDTLAACLPAAVRPKALEPIALPVEILTMAGRVDLNLTKEVNLPPGPSRGLMVAPVNVWRAQEEIVASREAFEFSDDSRDSDRARQYAGEARLAMWVLGRSLGPGPEDEVVTWVQRHLVALVLLPEEELARLGVAPPIKVAEQAYRQYLIRALAEGGVDLTRRPVEEQARVRARRVVVQAFLRAGGGLTLTRRQGRLVIRIRDMGKLQRQALELLEALGRARAEGPGAVEGLLASFKGFPTAGQAKELRSRRARAGLDQPLIFLPPTLEVTMNLRGTITDVRALRVEDLIAERLAWVR